MFKKIPALIVFITILVPTFAQTPWTLERCVMYAFENNIQIKQSLINAQITKNALLQSKASILPDLNAGAGYNFNFGSSVDPFTYQFTENNVQSFNANISSSLNLFSGFRTYNSIQRDKFNWLAQMSNVDRIKNDISLNIAMAYLNILFTQEMAANTARQAEAIRLQMERSEKLMQAGSIARGNYLEVVSQAATEELQLVNAQNNYREAILTMIQLLELDSTAGFSVANPMLDSLTFSPILPNIDDVFALAQGMPQVKVSEYNLEYNKRSLRIARSYASPSLALNASYGTGYSDSRKLYELLPGTVVPIEKEYPFSDQLNDNISTTFGIRLNIPIFNNLQVHAGVSNAKLNIANAELQLQATKNQLYKEIQAAHGDVMAAQVKYRAAQEALKASSESFVYTQQKFEVGMLNALDYNNAKNALMRAESELLQAKYDYIFKYNVLNFYSGLPIRFN